MSKYVKGLIEKDLQQRLEGVGDALLVNVVGMEVNQNVILRQKLREKDIHLLVVKTSLAKRATEGTSLAPAFDTCEGSLALVWGGEDIVSLAKEVVKLAEDEAFAPFAPKGGVMDGSPLTAENVKQVSKWPSRTEQLSILVGQILSPGANLAGQLLGPGGMLASQIEKKAGDDE